MAGTSEASTNIIYPPIDIKTIADKTAEHVAKSGEAFQQLIRDKYQGNAKFSFIYPNDPYFAYYEHMVEQFKSGEAAGTSDLKSAAPTSDIAAEMILGGADAAENSGASTDSKQATPQKPDPLQFISTMPAVSAQDLDVIKLTAQFVARNGRQFMTALAQREANNYQFDFLSPQHSLFGYFCKLVDQYTLAFFPPTELRERLDNDIRDKYKILERAKRRMEWVAFEEEERKQKAEEAEKEKEAFLSIDWHDFVVVGAVEFVEEDAFADLPIPLRLQDLKSMSLEAKHKSADSQANKVPGAVDALAQTTVQDGRFSGDKGAQMVEEEEDDDVEMEMDDDDVDEEIEAERNPQAPTAPPASALSIGPMKIRKDYVPNLRHGPQIAEVMLKCQLCGQEIPASEFEEHIRVELIDPKWKEQKLVYENKIRDSNLVKEGVDIADYLKRLAEHRSATSRGLTSEKGDEEADASKDQDRVYWDGYTSSAGRATRRARENMSAEDKVAASHIRKGLADPREASAQIGPQMPTSTAKRHKK
ncbi:SF3a splicing factor complex subunit [Coemansia guatemalensis]|uniref:SF3a splicing factor complex subunit n=1 Tax=Coemansia guatemalensis TaxID=2761395 RepID=A0A9W8HRT4_9FUNG|nr:SF3a splicing factor complex subunit [Coemansia guatemalensis]